MQNKCNEIEKRDNEKKIVCQTKVMKRKKKWRDKIEKKDKF